jgi:hypothetical protein
MQPTYHAPSKEQFDLLYGQFKDYHDSSIDAAFKLVGFLILVTGWVLTSREARGFLAGDLSARRAAVSVIVLVGVAVVAFAFRALHLSRNAYRRLQELGYMPRQYYEDLLMTPLAAAMYVGIVLAMIGALCVFLLGISN